MNLSLESLPINVFDFVFVAFLVAGIFHGRKHGMSEELLDVVKWLLILVGCAFFYETGGRLVAQSTPLAMLSSFVVAYAGSAIIIFSVFALIKRGFGGKLLGSDIFGGSEYYLGMGAGLVRFCCMLLSALALLNARYFSPQEVKAMENYQNVEYGSNYFPTLHTIQATVFERSLLGPWIKEHLGFLLIKSTKPAERHNRKEFELP